MSYRYIEQGYLHLFEKVLVEMELYIFTFVWEGSPNLGGRVYLQQRGLGDVPESA